MMPSRIGSLFVGLSLTCLLAASPAARASNCSGTFTGLVPLTELGQGLYLGLYQGGLYPNGRSRSPSAHGLAGFALAGSIEPLGTNGVPDPAGTYVLLSIGMSNTTQEFCSANSSLPCDPWTFMGQAAASPNVNHAKLTIVNGARGGQAAADWESPASPNYDRVRDTRLAPLGLSEAQVQAVWIKQADPRPTVSLPDPNADAFELVQRLGNIVRAVKLRYPNVKIVLLSSRIYAGYADTPLNPEPYAYENGFSIKWLIEAQINQMAGGGVDPLAGDLDFNTVGAWIGWGPYLWADGLTPRADGLLWRCDDFQSDGTHPAQSGEQKVGTLLLNHMLRSPFAAPWFRADGGSGLPGDADGDCDVDLTDLAIVLANFGASGPNLPGDLDGDNHVDLTDLARVLAAFGRSCF